LTFGGLLFFLSLMGKHLLD